MSMARTLMIAATFALVAVACSSSEDTTTSRQPATSTTATTTTTALVTTTTAVETTTTTGGGDTTTTTGPGEAAEIAATSAIGLLQPYVTEGADLFPPASVEAHWYQWEGLYVVLYRGFDAAAGQAICAGNSVLIEGADFNNRTNSPYLAGEELCVDAPTILLPPDGVQACGSLLYYLTEIPIDATGTLFGTLEIGLGGDVFVGQTSQATSDPAVPQFQPGLAAYRLPPSDVDDLGTIGCGG